MKRDSFLDLYSRYAMETTDAPESYHAFMGLASLSTIIGNKVFLPWGDGRLYPNLWLILLGRSTWDRKTTAMMIGKRLVDRMGLNRVYPNEFSYESLIKLLAENPSGSFYFSEFKSFLGLLSREYMSGARELLADLYDASYRFRRKLSGEEFVIDFPSMCMCAATSLTWFVDGLKDSDFGGGFLERFLFIPGVGNVEPKPRRYEADKKKFDKMKDIVKEISNIKGPFYVTVDAWKINDQWYHEARKKLTGGRLDPFIGRLHGYLLKFAMLITLNESHALKCQPEYMLEAKRLVDWLWKEFKKLEKDEISTSKEETWANKIKKYLKGGEMKQSDLLRSTHLSAKQLRQAVGLLMDREEIHCKPVRNPDTKRETLFYSLKGEK